MYKTLLWATYVASALATLNSVIAIEKRQSSTEVGVVQVNVSSSNATLKYFPEDGSTLTNLPIGTVIQFNFMPKNHTVTESSFDDPCHPIAANVTEAKGREPIKTGFVPVLGNETFTKAFRIEITDTKPIWLYCGQVGHCQKGMVMVINQNTSDTTDKTLANFRAKAAQVPLPNATSGSTVSTATASATADAVSPAAVSTDAAGGPTLAASATSTNPTVFVASKTNVGAAMPTQAPGRLAALGGLAVAGAVALL